MQIFPLLAKVNLADNSHQEFNLSQKEDFAQFLSQAQAPTNQLKTGAAQNVSREENFLASPVQEEDFARIKEFLVKAGLSKQSLNKLRDKLKTGKLSWQELLGAVPQVLQVQLSSLDKTVFLKFLQKLGFSPEQAKKEMNQLLAGKVEQFRKDLLAKIRALPPEKTISVNKAELQVLSKFLGSSKDQISAQLKSFEGELAKDGLKNLTLTFTDLLSSRQIKKWIKQFANLKSGQRGLKNQLFEERVAPVFNDRPSKERKNVQVESKGSVGKDKKVNNGTKSVSVQNNANADVVRNRLVQVDRLEHDLSGEHKSEKKAEFIQEVKQRVQGKLSASRESNLEQESEHKKNFDLFQNLNSGKANFVQNTSGLANTFSKNKQSVEFKQVWQQVEKGVLQNLSQGRSRAVLQLDPPDLGRVGLLLQINKNEVKLILRTSSEDTSHILNQHLHQLKIHLEQEGFRVQKLEVKTGLQEQPQFNLGQQEQSASQDGSRQDLFRQRIGLSRQRYFLAPDLPVTELEGVKEENISSRVNIFA